MNAENTARLLLAAADIRTDGHNPWDMEVLDARVFARVFAQGSLGLGEAYMDGWWRCAALDEFFHRLIRAKLHTKLRLSPRLAWLVLSSALANRQNSRRVWQAADVHYDLPVDVFEATFDQRLTGSCAYWEAADDLDRAQEAKLDLICRKAGLDHAPGALVWDIGCGWGAFMGYAAETYDLRCVGVTVSKEQAAYVRQRYANRPVEVRVEDYRAFSGKVDHAVSMGMFEHVGPKNYRTYFETVHRALKPKGLLILHTIWANEASPHIDPWLDRYIFPNGVLPTPSQLLKATEGLFVIEDVHNFGVHYDRTLMAWNANFQSNRSRIAAEMGERFCRMWEYYLLSCAGGFRSRGISVGQYVLSPEGVRGGWTRPPLCN